MAAASLVSSSQILRPIESQAHSEASHETRHGAINSFKNQTSAYHGLRALNQVDMLHARTMPKTNLSRSRSSTVQATRSPVIVCGTGMNIVFVAAEAAPWSKTGGLGDVLGGLPPALGGRGHRVMSVSPRYDQYKDAWDTGVVVEIKVGKELYNVRYYHSYKDGVDRVFVDHPMFLERVWGTTGPKLYGPKPGEDYPDNDKRFSVLNQAAIEATRVLNLNSSPNISGPYGEDVVFVCNDWHTALLPVYLKNSYKSHGSYRNAKSVLCIHNISYQGRFPFEEFETLGLPDGAQSSLEFVERYNGGVKKINWMKGGIMETDRVLTVSPYYAEELVSSPFKGMELENVLRKTGVTGILNGVDVLEWNPAADKYIPFKYDMSTVSQAKPRDKEALQAELGLPVNRNIPMIGFIARLEEQKGSDIFAASVPEFIGENVQVVALGTGKPKFEEQLKQLEKKYPNKVRGMVKYSPDLAHKIIAGSDFMLITSRFEPGGLIQLQSMRYGTVPIVSSTGGLVNSVIEGYTGFHMGAFDVDGTKVNTRDVTVVTSTVKRALGVYGTPTLDRMISNCMSQDFSWTESAEKWEKVLMGVAAGAVQREEELAPRARSVAVAA